MDLQEDFSISSDVTNNFSLFRESPVFRAHNFYMTWGFLPPSLASPLLGPICLKYRSTLPNASTYTEIEPHTETDFSGTEAHSALTTARGCDTATVHTPTWHTGRAPTSHGADVIYEELTAGQRLQVR